VTVWAVVCAAYFRVPQENDSGIGDERGWYSRRGKGGHPVAVEDYSEFDFYQKAQKLKRIESAVCDPGPGRDESGYGACVPVVLVDVDRFDRATEGRGHVLLEPGLLSPEVTLVTLQGAIGIVGMVLGPRVHLVDVFGLTDPIGSRMALTRRGRPGHEKRFSKTWVVARYGRAGAWGGLSVSAAKEALECPPLKDLQMATSGPVTFSRFLENLFASVRFHALRIPTNPAEAKKKFCRMTAG
jgi:arabinofuranosyltransferase